MKKLVAVLFALALVGMFVGSSLAADKPIAAFKAKTLDGKDFTNANIKEKQVMFVIAQTACRQCQFELKDMDKYADELKGKAYVVLVDMNVDAAKEYYAKKGYKSEVLLDPDFSIPGAADLTSSPSTIIVDKKGNIIFSTQGYTPGQLDDIKAKL